MIDVKKAVQIAKSYFKDLYPDNAFSHVMLEEVEREEEDDALYWLITIGFTNHDAPTKESPLGTTIFGPKAPRRYKRFKINAETGDVISMKIRAVENA